MSVTAMAEKLNYADAKALRKAIKRITGKTPSEIRSDPGALHPEN